MCRGRSWLLDGPIRIRIRLNCKLGRVDEHGLIEDGPRGWGSDCEGHLLRFPCISWGMGGSMSFGWPGMLVAITVYAAVYEVLEVQRESYSPVKASKNKMRWPFRMTLYLLVSIIFDWRNFFWLGAGRRPCDVLAMMWCVVVRRLVLSGGCCF
jgi:hypothetical protein